MKKVISLFLALTFVFTLAACSNNQPQTNDSSESLSEPTTESAETPADISASESSESENGKTLVVYFSATGNTEAAATYIAQETGGDLFELEPAEPYTDEDLNYSNEDSTRMNPCGMWSLRRIPWKTGMNTIPCLSDIPFGGILLRGR